MEDFGKKPTGVQNPFRKKARDEAPPPIVEPLIGTEPPEAHAGYTDIGSNPSSEVDEIEWKEIELGKSIAAKFKEMRVHPVLIFGSKGSGKTSLIASMLKYMLDRPESEASVQLDESLLPTGDSWWSESVDWSRDLFFKKVLAYVDNAAPDATQEAQPFFVPVRISKKSGGDVLFAFLEGKGEWYQPDFSQKVPFRKLRGFLKGMLQNFNESATIVYVAPYVTGSAREPADSPHLRTSDLGLLGVLDELKAERRALLHRDNHLFLVTKWDVFCESIAASSFIEPETDEIVGVIRERYPLSWARYMNANVATETQNKNISAYCAGLIDGTTVNKTAEDDDANVAFYARKLWDWLHLNATGQVLYPDVHPKPPGFLDRCLAWIRG